MVRDLVQQFAIVGAGRGHVRDPAGLGGRLWSETTLAPAGTSEHERNRFAKPGHSRKR
jgi:hypothetical protein